MANDWSYPLCRSKTHEKSTFFDLSNDFDRWHSLCAQLTALGNSTTNKGEVGMEEIITPSQVANLLQIHVKTVYRLASQGTIPGNRIGRSWRFSRSDILKLVNGSDGKSPDFKNGDAKRLHDR